jgi:hypothetical protein
LVGCHDQKTRPRDGSSEIEYPASGRPFALLALGILSYWLI